MNKTELIRFTAERPAYQERCGQIISAAIDTIVENSHRAERYNVGFEFEIRRGAARIGRNRRQNRR